jgi:hypothetical protein
VNEASHVPSSSSTALAEFGTLLGRIAAEGGARPFAKIEAEITEAARCLVRAALAEELVRRDVDAPAVMVDGVRHNRALRAAQTYMTVAGEVTVERNLYRLRGERCVCPVELRSGIIEGFWTPGAARAAAWTVAHVPPAEAEEFFARHVGMSPSRSSLDRLPKALSAHWEDARPQYEADVRAVEVVPAVAVAVAVSLDGVLTPMKDGGRADKRAATAAEGRPTKGPAGYREVGVGTVSLYDADGERLSTVVQGRMPESKKAELKASLAEELQHIRAQRPDLVVVKVADGARDNWTWLSRVAPGGIEVVDYFHAAQHLRTAVDAAHGEGTPRALAVAAKLRERLLTPNGVESVIRSLRHLATSHPKSKVLRRELAYFRNNRRRMRYHEIRERNLPIGSGIVEASCKTLVTERLKRSGMRWLNKGGQAILTLRALVHSDRFDRAWPMLAARYCADVRPANNTESFGAVEQAERRSA